mgnify:CR=1 FL=1|jgi:hypothetical protein
MPQGPAFHHWRTAFYFYLSYQPAITRGWNKDEYDKAELVYKAYFTPCPTASKNSNFNCTARWFFFETGIEVVFEWGLRPFYLTTWCNKRKCSYAHDLCHSQIKYFRNAINLNRKDRATRGAGACAARAIPHSFNRSAADQYPIPRQIGIYVSLQPREQDLSPSRRPLRYVWLSSSGLGYSVAAIPRCCRLGQSGEICDGHHRCDDLCYFFAQGYAGCKSNSGGRSRTVCPRYPERSAALIYRCHWFPLPIPNLRVYWNGDLEVAFCNHTKTHKACSFHAIVDVPSGR